MTKATLITNHTEMATAMRAMLNVQKEYFTERKMGMPGTAKLEKCKKAEAITRALFKQLHHPRPQIIEADIKPLIHDYNHFLDRCKVLLTAQWHWFNNPGNRPLQKKCKSLEKDMREYLTKFFTRQHTAQQATLL